jgi:mRNA interferase RelE/StbE
MEYTLLYTRTAGKDIQKINVATRKKLGLKLKKLETNPLGLSKKLSNSPIGHYRYRIGDYRIIFNIVGQTIVILRVRHRREVYRK